MIRNQREFLRFMKLLNDNDCLEHMVLIGSWAEYLYSELNILLNYESNVKTLDVDFLIKNLKKPIKPINIINLAKEEGFLIETDRLNGVTKIFDPDGLEIEFLIAKRGKGVENAMKTNLGVTAEALRHLELLSNHTIITPYLGMDIEIPMPEAFVIHKIVINSKRKEKTEKDQKVINEMFLHLDKTVFEDILKTLPKRDQKKVEEYMTLHIVPEKERRALIETAKERIKKQNK